MLNLSRRNIRRSFLISLLIVFVVMVLQAVGFWIIHHEIDETPQDIQALGESREFWIFGILSAVLILIILWIQLTLVRRERSHVDLHNEFVDSVTHQIKTPLSTILVAAEALASREVHEPFQREQYLALIRNEGAKLNTELDRVLEVKGITQRGIRLNKRMMSIREELDAVLEDFKIVFEKNNANYEVIWNVVEDQISFDPRYFQVIISNIVDNAVKYNLSSLHLKITLSKHWDELILSIEDNGIGIQESNIGQVFEKFYRVPQEEGQVNGFGLGLYLTQQLMKAHKASVLIESEFQVGTRVQLRFPTKTK